MPAADYQLIVIIMRAAAQYDPCLAIGSLVECLNLVDGDQRSPMNANEVIGEFRFERFERFVDQAIPVLVRDGDVFLIGAKKIDVVDRYQGEAILLTYTDMFSRCRHTGLIRDVM